MKIDALHLVALGIDEAKKRGTHEHAKAVKLKDAAIKEWKSQLWDKKKCKHCGQEI